MSMLCFLPWTTTTEALWFGRFHVVPLAEAVRLGEIPPEDHDAITAILDAYGQKRAVDRRDVPLIRRDDLTFTADLTDEQVADYFEFRTRLTFAVLAARRFFSVRYANSDNTRLVIQGFTPERAGAALIETRRRDGVARLIVPKGHLLVRRPDHVSSWCELPKDLDVPLLTALEAATASASWPAMAEAIRLFVGANTDSPDVGMHTELIDVMSAFSRLAGAWNEKGTVRAFVEALPSPIELDARYVGPKTADPRLATGRMEKKLVREVWLSDAYVLRSQLGHGHVDAPPYRSTWTIREHLLLAAVALPLYIKALLCAGGLYTPTTEDEVLNVAFDGLATLEPFALTTTDNHSPWSEMLSRARIQVWINAYHWEAQVAPEAGGAAADSSNAGDSSAGLAEGVPPSEAE